jgi:hypothetical protein
MNSGLRIALATASTILAFVAGIVFIHAKHFGSSGLWLTASCNLAAGFGFSHALLKNNSLKNLFAVLLGGFLCMLDFLAFAFGGCSGLL